MPRPSRRKIWRSHVPRRPWGKSVEPSSSDPRSFPNDSVEGGIYGIRPNASSMPRMHWQMPWSRSEPEPKRRSSVPTCLDSTPYPTSRSPSMIVRRSVATPPSTSLWIQMIWIASLIPSCRITPSGVTTPHSRIRVPTPPARSRWTPYWR